jgi:hypothetical protein
VTQQLPWLQPPPATARGGGHDLPSVRRRSSPRRPCVGTKETSFKDVFADRDPTPPLAPAVQLGKRGLQSPPAITAHTRATHLHCLDGPHTLNQALTKSVAMTYKTYLCVVVRLTNRVPAMHHRAPRYLLFRIKCKMLRITFLCRGREKLFL